MNKICLGTVQFGLDYGMVNRTIKINKEEVFDILSCAQESGINTLDTAYSYGESESVIGEFIERNKSNLKVISKLPALKDKDAGNREDIIYHSLNRLRSKQIYGYLIHSFADFLYDMTIWERLVYLKNKDIIKKIGFSIYKPEELEILLSKKISFDIVQIPYSVFDHRFEFYLPMLKERNTDVYARSIFLQGLVFSDPEKLPDNLEEAGKYLKNLREFSLETAIPIHALCLNFVLCNPRVDKVVIGVAGLKHLKTNLESIRFIQSVKDIYWRFDSLKVENEDLLLPYRWGCLPKINESL